MSYKFVLAGNPNCGKTTMFNEITGSNQYVGNWPGVTVEKKEGKAKSFKEDIQVVDLPGIYSLSPYSMEEIIARDYILEEKPDVVINIVDASNLERNLYLTTQLLELGVPVVVVLNMMDMVKARGDEINITQMERSLGVPVVPASARKGQGVNEVIEQALQVAQSAVVSQEKTNLLYDEKIEKCLNRIQQLLSPYLEKDNRNHIRWFALRMLVSDGKARRKLTIPESVVQEIACAVNELGQQYQDNIETVIADRRYQYISKLLGDILTQKNIGSETNLSDKIDSIVTNTFTGIPIFLMVMLVMFQATFGPLGSAVTDWLDGLLNEQLVELISKGLAMGGAADWLQRLIVDGIFAGVGGVLVFVPQITILFLIISILEDSGYMARAAFVMNRVMKKLGLSGKSFIPMIMGFGCSVPAIMAARTLDNERDKKLTIMLSPFMSCGARLPIYALFTAAFFVKSQSMVIYSLYLLGVIVAILSGFVLRKAVFKGEMAPFVIELPPYRIPTIKGLLIHTWDRVKEFIKKAGTIIFAGCVIIWFLQTFNFSLQMVENTANSILAGIGKFIAPLFSPLGFGNWKASVSLLTGLVAKEMVVATLGILYGLGEVAEESVEFQKVLQVHFTPLKAYAFMVFTLLYFPCIATLGAMKREFNSWKWTLFAVTYQTGTAWIVAFLIYNVGRLAGLS